MKIVLVLLMQQKNPLGMSAAKVFVKRGTILKADKLTTISSSVIKTSFVPGGLASDLQTTRIGGTAESSHCHLTRPSLQPTAELNIAHH